MVEWRGGLWAWARGLKKMPTFRGGGAGLGDAMMPHLRKHALLPADAGQRSHSSVVRPSLPGLFLSPSSSSCTCAAFASQPRLDPSPHMSVSRGREREKAVCVPTPYACCQARRATPRHRCATPRVAVEDSRWWWMGRDWTGRTLRLRRGVDLPGSIHSFRRPTRRARLRRPTPTTQYTPVEWQPCHGAEWGEDEAEPARAAARGVRFGSLRGPLQTDGGWGEDLQPRPPETAGPTTPPSCVGLC